MTEAGTRPGLCRLHGRGLQAAGRVSQLLPAHAGGRDHPHVQGDDGQRRTRRRPAARCRWRWRTPAAKRWRAPNGRLNCPAWATPATNLRSISRRPPGNARSSPPLRWRARRPEPDPQSPLGGGRIARQAVSKVGRTWCAPIVKRQRNKSAVAEFARIRRGFVADHPNSCEFGYVLRAAKRSPCSTAVHLKTILGGHPCSSHFA